MERNQSERENLVLVMQRVRKLKLKNSLLGVLAQLGEHLLCKQGVTGSNPVYSTTWEDWQSG